MCTLVRASPHFTQSALKPAYQTAHTYAPHDAHHTPHTTHHTPHAARRTPHAARRTPHAARSQSTYGLLPTDYCLRTTTHGPQATACGLLPTDYCLRATAYGLLPMPLPLILQERGAQWASHSRVESPDPSPVARAHVHVPCSTHPRCVWY